MDILDSIKLRRKKMKKKIVKFRKYEELEGQIVQDNYTDHFTPFSHYDFYAAGVLETEILPEVEPISVPSWLEHILESRKRNLRTMRNEKAISYSAYLLIIMHEPISD